MSEKKISPENVEDAATPLKFESALEELETLVESMEQGKMSLDEMLGAFERGQSLIRFCGQKLNEVERRIEVLLKKDNGEIVLEPFDEGATPPQEENAELAP